MFLNLPNWKNMLSSLGRLYGGKQQAKAFRKQHILPVMSCNSAGPTRGNHYVAADRAAPYFSSQKPGLH